MYFFSMTSGARVKNEKSGAKVLKETMWGNSEKKSCSVPTRVDMMMSCVTRNKLQVLTQVNGGFHVGCWQQCFLCVTLPAPRYLGVRGTQKGQLVACSVGITLVIYINGEKVGQYLLRADSQFGYVVLWAKSDGTDETASLWLTWPSCSWKGASPIASPWLKYLC